MSECSSDLYKPPKGLVNSSSVIEFGGPHIINLKMLKYS